MTTLHRGDLTAMPNGKSSSHCCPLKKPTLVDLPKTIVASLTAFCGFNARVHHGMTYPLAMVTEAQCPVAFTDGDNKAFGKESGNNVSNKPTKLDGSFVKFILATVRSFVHTFMLRGHSWGT